MSILKSKQQKSWITFTILQKTMREFTKSKSLWQFMCASFCIVYFYKEILCFLGTVIVALDSKENTHPTSANVLLLSQGIGTRILPVWTRKEGVTVQEDGTEIVK